MERTTREKNIKREELAKPLDVSLDRFRDATDVCQFFLKAFLDEEEAKASTPEDLAEDLSELDLVPAEKSAALLGLLRGCKTVATGSLEAEVRKRGVALAVLPCASSISTSTNLRAIFDRRFHVEDTVESYSPMFQGVVPVAIVHIEFDQGPIKDIHFQADKRSLALLIDHLRSVQTEIAIAEEFVEVKVPQDK